ncbi:hypothetical protein POM88_002187 [Heracleum sosnowskyi]|uniref:Uncharacterized protein n=1 Tax=Heracleum sosnowskyi TaxID=360622 RepID=A0AAD8JHI7_9APIA|nr:hypothetical protein POM88_002187 [Heracleum sosnowskyi]
MMEEDVVTKNKSSIMEDEDEAWPWTYEEVVAILHNPNLLKQNFSKYWSSIQKYYESTTLPKALPKLSPLDHRKWRLESHSDKEISSVVIKVASSVVAVSVFVGVRRYFDCSGFVIHWDVSTGKATIITSAKIMRFPGKRDDYYHYKETGQNRPTKWYLYIAVRLASGKILLAEENYVDFYNNIVTLKVNSDAPLIPFESYLNPLETVDGVVVALGREFYNYKLSESSGLIRKDHPYFGCELLVSSTCGDGEVLEGGPLITRRGHGCGINFFDGSIFVHPLPTSVIYSCLNKWNSNHIVMRPWFGLTVIDSSQLPHDALENIAGVPGDSTAVVKEVYEGAPADKVGVHRGETYAEQLSKISGKLSACCPDKMPEVLVSVRGYDSDIYKVVHAENLRVDDKKFCCSWVVDESDERPEWDMEPRFGSQMDAAHELHDV